MKKRGLNIMVLSSSRADFSIYLPLLKKIQADSYFNLKIAAFGSHLSKMHGYTLDYFYKEGLEVAVKVESMPDGDTAKDISYSMGVTFQKFSQVWEEQKEWIDAVICLGDRYEMFAAVSASVPFNIPVIHIHGGETTLGAIDNVFRHSLTIMSQVHFASTKKSAEKIMQLKGDKKNIYNVGALSLDNLKTIKLLSKEEFQKSFYNIDLNIPSVLVTYHPETVSIEKNESNVQELLKALDKLNYQIIFTMPNADTMGNLVRAKIQTWIENKKNAYAVESLGTLGYFSCIQHCKFLVGNSSSGIIEAASFQKYVINLGDRQKGRETGSNVFHCEAKKETILKIVKKIEALPKYRKANIYGDGKTADKILKVLKKL